MESNNKKYNIKKGDKVVVITGASKDYKTPREVLAVHYDTDRVLVEGVNVRTKHQKPNAQNTEGGIVQEEAPIHISNVMLWDASASAGTRVSRERTDTGYKRISKKSNSEI